MIYPIHIIGMPVLRQVAVDIDKNYPDLDAFIADMHETMYDSDGLGLAAPQVGKSIRLFVIDASPLGEDFPELENFKKVMINAHITEYSDDKQKSQEGCLSIPGVHEDVERSLKIRIQYYDENWEYHDDTFEGMAAIVMQHEYDHLDGILFTDKIAPLRKKLIKKRLMRISKGEFEKRYKFRIKRT